MKTRLPIHSSRVWVRIFPAVISCALCNWGWGGENQDSSPLFPENTDKDLAKLLYIDSRGELSKAPSGKIYEFGALHLGIDGKTARSNLINDLSRGEWINIGSYIALSKNITYEAIAAEIVLHIIIDRYHELSPGIYLANKEFNPLIIKTKDFIVLNANEDNIEYGFKRELAKEILESEVLFLKVNGEKLKGRFIK